MVHSNNDRNMKSIWKMWKRIEEKKEGQILQSHENCTRVIRIRSNDELLNWNRNKTKWTIYIIRKFEFKRMGLSIWKIPCFRIESFCVYLYLDTRFFSFFFGWFLFIRSNRLIKCFETPIEKVFLFHNFQWWAHVTKSKQKEAYAIILLFQLFYRNRIQWSEFFRLSTSCENQSNF